MTGFVDLIKQTTQQTSLNEQLNNFKTLTANYRSMISSVMLIFPRNSHKTKATDWCIIWQLKLIRCETSVVSRATSNIYMQQGRDVLTTLEPREIHAVHRLFACTPIVTHTIAPVCNHTLLTISVTWTPHFERTEEQQYREITITKPITHLTHLESALYHVLANLGAAPLIYQPIIDVYSNSVKLIDTLSTDGAPRWFLNFALSCRMTRVKQVKLTITHTPYDLAITFMWWLCRIQETNTDPPVATPVISRQGSKGRLLWPWIAHTLTRIPTTGSRAFFPSTLITMTFVQGTKILRTVIDSYDIIIDLQYHTTQPILTAFSQLLTLCATLT